MFAHNTQLLQLSIPDFLNLPFLEALLDAVTAALEQIKSLLELTKGALELVRAFIIDIAKPLAAILDALRQQLYDLIQTFRDAGIQVIPILPSLAKPMRLEDCFNELAQSIKDKGDPNRPITDDSNQTAVETTIFVLSTGVAAGWDAVSDFIETIQKFIDIRPFLDLFETAFTRTYPQQGGPEYLSVYPDWYAGKLVDELPWLGQLLDTLEALADMLPLSMSFTELLDRFIVALDEKIALMERLISDIALLLEGYNAVVGLQFAATVISGSGTRDELFIAIGDAAQSVAVGYTEPVVTERELRLGRPVLIGPADSVGALVAIAVTGPAASLLADIFGVELDD